MEGGAYPKKTSIFSTQNTGKEKRGIKKKNKIKGECVSYSSGKQGRG